MSTGGPTGSSFLESDTVAMGMLAAVAVLWLIPPSGNAVRRKCGHKTLPLFTVPCLMPRAVIGIGVADT